MCNGFTQAHYPRYQARSCSLTRYNIPLRIKQRAQGFSLALCPFSLACSKSLISGIIEGYQAHYVNILMKDIEIIVGSMLGATEYVADELKAKLTENGFNATIHLKPNLEEINPENLWFVCSSTHGAGDLPDNIEPFSEQIKTQDLSNVRFAIVGLGDTSYDTFCEGAKQLATTLQTQSAKLIHQPIYIDVLEYPIPEEAAVEWLNHWLAAKPELL